jgi:hypothetical protein
MFQNTPLLSWSLVAVIVGRSLSSEDVALTSHSSMTLAVTTLVSPAFISSCGRPRKCTVSPDSFCTNNFPRQHCSSLRFFPLISDSNTKSFVLQGVSSSHHPSSVLQSNIVPLDDVSDDNVVDDTVEEDAYVDENSADKIVEATDVGMFVDAIDFDEEEDDEEEENEEEYDDEDGDETCFDNDPAIPLADFDLVTQAEQVNKDNLFQINQYISKSLGIELEYASISVQDLFLPFKRNSTEGIISLSNFDPIFRMPMKKDGFFPLIKKLLVRQTMKRIMKRYTWDDIKVKKMAPQASTFVLIGSPGTGKSLLFFLAAVWKASRGKQPILYLRRSGVEPISIFYMFPDGPNKVGMHFKRLQENESMKNKALADLPQICFPLEEAINKVLPSQPQSVVFLDGPRHDDKVNTFQGNFEHLCTSGGYPQPKNQDRNKIFVWALDGWSEKEMIQALCLFYGQVKKEAREIYYICGGCMRDAASAVTNEGKELVMEDLNTTVNGLQDAEVRIAIRQIFNQDVSQNRLRTITVFNKKHKHLTDIYYLLHKVDSKFVQELLLKRGGLLQARQAYIDAVEVDKSELAGWSYKSYWHKWFEIKKPNGIKYFRARGNNQPATAKGI